MTSWILIFFLAGQPIFATGPYERDGCAAMLAVVSVGLAESAVRVECQPKIERRVDQNA